MHIFAIIQNLRIQDILDILFLTVVVYYLYQWFRGTKAFKALVGLLALGLVFTVSRSWGLFLTTWAFQILWQVLIVLIIILFQTEIRQVLERVNPLQFLGLRSSSVTAGWITELSKALFRLAEEDTGALVIFERKDMTEELVIGGIFLDAEPSPEILLSIFQKQSPLHDGAILIRKERIARAACYLPLSSADGLPGEWGTRHRAALGLSERCDAWIVVVSEERGEISVARRGQMIKVSDTEQLSKLIREAIDPPDENSMTRWEKTQALMVRRWQAKLGVFVLVSIFWLLLAGQQNFEVTVQVPIEIKNVPPNMTIVDPLKPEVEVTVRGLRKDASILNERNVRVELDLSMARFGTRVFRITQQQIELPNDRVNVISVNPSQLLFKMRETSSNGN